jgi:hypothetical protein
MAERGGNETGRMRRTDSERDFEASREDDLTSYTFTSIPLHAASLFSLLYTVVGLYRTYLSLREREDFLRANNDRALKFLNGVE